MMALRVISKGIAFFRNAVFAAIFGATAQTDAFYLSLNIVGVLSGITQSVETTTVPMRLKIESEEGPAAANRYSSAILTIAVLFSAILIVLTIVFAEPVVRIFAPGFEDDIFRMAVTMTRICAPLMVVFSTIFAFTGVLNANRDFFPAQLLGVPLSIVWILIVFAFSGSLGIYAMIAGYCLGTLTQVLFLFFSVRKIFRFRPGIRWKNPDVRQTLLLSVPIFLSSSANMLNQTIDKALASGLPEGSVSALYNASLLTSLVTNIIFYPVTTALFALLSGYLANNRKENVAPALSRAGISMMLLLAPIVTLCVIFREQIVRIVYLRGAFDAAASLLTSRVFVYYALGLLPGCVSSVYLQYFYAKRDTRVSMVVSLIGFAVNIVFNLILIRSMQAAGLALASSISGLVTCAICVAWVRKDVKQGFAGADLWKDIGKMLVSLIAVIPAALLIRGYFASNDILSFGFATIAGFGLYGGALLLLRQKDTADIADKMIRLLFKNNRWGGSV